MEFGGGSISTESLDSILNALQKEAAKYYFTNSSEANLHRIFSAMYDKSLFLSELSKYPHHVEIVTAIAASSNYLTDIVVRNPEYLYQIFDQGYLSEQLTDELLKKEIANGIESFKSFQAKLNYLRQIKKRFTLKIGINDILGFDNLDMITRQLSYLAKAINGELFDLCYNEILNKYNLKIDGEKYCLCSLGKLGGNELNYSSDVDMILFYDEDMHVEAAKKEYQEILIEAALLYIKSSTAVTDRGYIYRVDFRLRPDGIYSPLSRVLGDYLKYYETRGEDWERQMLIKIDLVCGNKMLYKKFTDFLQPYIYPSSFSTSLKEQIKKMKINIERQNKVKDDVKLFAGGIRDIEFAVQGLQLLNGGRFKGIRTGNSLEAIELLSSKNLLKEAEKKILTEAYIFYRRVEHFLQLMNDTQTHEIPSEGELLCKLSNYTGFDSIDDFKNKLDNFRQDVRNIYEEILFTDSSFVEFFTGLEFADQVKAEKNIKYLRSGTGISGQKGFDSRTINLFENIEHHLQSYLKKSPAPDRILDNFVKVVQASLFPSIWYSEFTNEKFFELFLQICEYSQKAIDLISIDRMLEEFFFSRRVFAKNTKAELELFSTGQLVFLLAVQFSLGLIDPQKVSELITEFIEIKIKQTLAGLNLNSTYFIGAMGSFGSASMTFSSDIDLIVVTDDVNKYENIHSDFQNFILQIQKTLKPFEVDFRLRPEGKKSQLVWDISNYKRYLADRARIWEYQSFLKLRFIAGEKKLFNRLRTAIINQIKLLDKNAVREEIGRMLISVQKEFSSNRSSFNIKKQKGGLMGIDFLMQSFALANAEDFKKCMGKSIATMIKYFRQKFPGDIEELENNYKTLREIEFDVQNIFNTGSAVIPEELIKKKILQNFLKTEEDLKSTIVGIIRSNNKYLEKYLGI